MKLRTLLSIALAFTTVLALAEETKPIGLSARVGVFTPNDSTLRDSGTAWFAAGVDFTLSDLTLKEKPARLTGLDLALGIDYTFKNDVRQLPVLIEGIGHFGKVHVLAGVGTAFTRYMSNGSSVDKSKFAYAIGAGIDVFSNVGAPVFVEARFQGNAETSLNGYSFFVGTRL